MEKIKPVIKTSISSFAQYSSNNTGTIQSIHYLYSPTLSEIAGNAFELGFTAENNSNVNPQFSYF